MNLASIVAGHRGDGRALYDGTAWVTWGEVRARAAAVAATVQGAAGTGDRVAIAWPTSVEFVAAYLGVLAAGAVAVPLNPNSPGPELAGELVGVAPALILAGGNAP